MCRLLGVVFRGKFPADTLSELRILSENGHVPEDDRPGHRDGWGIATYRNGRPTYLGRSISPAFHDKAYDEAVEAATRIAPPNILIGHVRAASRGVVAIQNTHPFIIGNLVLAHNGTVNGLPMDDQGRATGQTDSELIAVLLAERMKEKKSLAAAMKSVITEDVDGREFTAAILLASDGKTLAGYRDYLKPDLAWYYGLKVARCRDNVTLFQETAAERECGFSEIRKRELISVDSELRLTSELL